MNRMMSIEFKAAVISAAFLCVEALCLLERVNRGEEVAPHHVIVVLAAVALEAIGCCLAN